MSAADTKLAEPLSILTPPGPPRESAWWLIVVVVGWYLLAQLPAFVFAFTETITLRAMRTTAAAAPHVDLLVKQMGMLGGQCVYLLGSLVRARIVGLGDLRAGLSFEPILRIPLIVLLVVLAAPYTAFLNMVAYQINPQSYGKIVTYGPWLASFTILIALMAAIVEELFFRGWLWNGLKTHWNSLLSASAVSFLWLLAHLEQGLFVFMGLIPVAVLLALARHFGRSVRASIAVHLTVNIVGVASPWVAAYS